MSCAPPLKAATYTLGGADRLPGQLAMLQPLELDLLCVQSAADWDGDHMARVTSELGMQGRIAPSRYGGHLVTLYRPSRLKPATYNPDVTRGSVHHTVALATFFTDDFEMIDVVHTHLAPGCPLARQREVSWLTPYAERGSEVTPRRYALCMGELEMAGVDDAEDPDIWSIIPPHEHSKHRLMREDGSYGGTDHRAMAALLQAGYVDPPVRLGMTPPRTAGYWIEQETGRRGETDRRTTHILLSPDLAPALEFYLVIDNESSRRLSHRLPVVVTLDPARLR
ncbi:MULTISPECIES: hypothetical protein [Streptomyces]|uniref:hypothetical protein n=1 Tax=Streptomyces TaxID=1883 RepID=UPI0004CDAB92|nr:MULTISPECIES: hypothetical protein [Streptomyces]KOT52696.1 hypothetical protein ADK43_29985 [Streptomyces rimosus subsp. rimosus]